MSKPNQSVDDLLRDLRAGKNDKVEVAPDGSVVPAQDEYPAASQSFPGGVKTRPVTFA